MLFPQKENAPLVQERPPFSGWHLALHPICSAALVTHGSETQLHLFHAADVWQTAGEGITVAKGKLSLYVVEVKVVQWYREKM